MYFHQHQFCPHLCIKDSVWNKETLLPVILSILPIGHYTSCHGGKSHHFLTRKCRIIIFWPENAADDIKVVTLQKEIVVRCLPGLPGGGTHTRPSLDPRSTTVTAPACQCLVRTEATEHSSWDDDQVCFWWCLKVVTQKCSRTGIRSLIWLTFQVGKCLLHTVLQQKFSSLKLFTARILS